jgi:hypothetical protein
MTTSQVLDRTFFLYRQNFLLFLGIALVGPGLTLMASLAQLAFFGPPVMPDPGKFEPAIFQSFFMRAMIAGLVSIVVYTVGQALASSATVHAVSMVHLGKTASIVESYRKIVPILWRIIGVFLRVILIAWWPIVAAYMLMVVAALSVPVLLRSGGGGAVGGPVVGIVILLVGLLGIFGGIVWAVFAYCRYGLAVPACTVEGLQPRYALRRSKFLSSGSLGRILGIFLLTLVMSWILTSVFQIPAFFFANPFAMKPGAVSLAYLFWAQLGSFLGQTLAGPIATIAIALVYYDERVRKEAFDLQLLIQSIEPPAQTQDAGLTPIGS